MVLPPNASMAIGGRQRSRWLARRRRSAAATEQAIRSAIRNSSGFWSLKATNKRPSTRNFSSFERNSKSNIWSRQLRSTGRTHTSAWFKRAGLCFMLQVANPMLNGFIAAGTTHKEPMRSQQSKLKDAGTTRSGTTRSHACQPCSATGFQATVTLGNTSEGDPTTLHLILAWIESCKNGYNTATGTCRTEGDQ